jgi:penicillin amidase
MAGTPPSRRTALKITGFAALAVVLLVIVPIIFVYGVLSGSRPKLDGAVSAPGLVAPVTITRDSLGIPTITAVTRADLAYGTGFAHAQDRFFQMDLSRRLAAGELSEIFGPLAVGQDRSARLFRFRSIAQEILAQSAPEQREAMEAYARGVNAGLASLRSRPWEYFLLQVTPAPWRAEDVVLVSFAMWWDLQHNSLERDRLRRAINLKLGGAECANGWKCALEFFYPRGTSWDSPNSATELADAAPVIRLPTAEELDVRAHVSRVSGGAPGPRLGAEGSNGWVVSGSLTEGGGALVASDMHLGLRAPVIWYRVRLQLKEPGGSAPSLDLNGLTLPGAPVMVVGSNTRIAWAYTNSYGDWTDLSFAACSAVDDTSLRTAADSIPLTTVQEKILVKGERAVTLAVRTAPSGVLYDADPASGRCWFARWLAMVPAATNLNIMNLETASSVTEAIDLAPTIGIPHQNFMVGDRDGHIGWSILGRIPDTADASLRLSGTVPWTTAANHPRLIDPPVGRIWTANSRPIEDASAEAAIGGDEAVLGSEYDVAARTRQVRDRLLAIKTPARPSDMLSIQLDDRGLFLARWQELLLETLDEKSLHDHPQRAELRRWVEGWDPRATPGSVGYRLVRAFRQQTEHEVWRMMLDALDLDAAGTPIAAQFEGPLWELVTKQPMHLLSSSYESWNAFLLEQADAMVKQLTLADESGASPCSELEDCTWGSRRPVLVRHPMSGAIPLVGSLLNMPKLELPGDHDMPRVQDGSFGASERFAVAPGREAEGYLHMPGGQSGHPLSPYYRAGFREWAEGKPLPFLPGAAEHTLTLEPASSPRS